MRHRRGRSVAARWFALVALAAAAAAATVAWTAPPTPGAIDALIADQQTLKAARLAEDALADAAPDAAVELRYLLFKAHVVDLERPKGDLYRRAVGKGDEGLEEYEKLVDDLEARVRAAGAAALPLLVKRLENGDALDRLLVLGLLGEMRVETPDLPWNQPAGETGVSPGAAAGRATLAAAADCVRQEATEPPDPILDHDAAVAERDDYFQLLYAVLSGLDFVSRVDPAAGAAAAAAALECRGTAGAVLQDRQRLERLRADLPEPLGQVLARTTSDDVRLDAALLLGRYGQCVDLPALQRLADSGAAPVAAAAGAAVRRLRMRLDCDG